MRAKARAAAACAISLILLALLWTATPTHAQTVTGSIKDRLVGHWQLVSITINGNMPYGSNPKGSMFLDADGHYAVIVISDGKARNIAFFGTYTVDDTEKSMTLHVDGGTRSGTDGHDQKRLVTFRGDELIQSNPPSNGPVGSITLTWKH